jgi:hypothetical protein
MIYRRNPAVVFQVIEDRVMLLDPRRAELITLTPSGSEVWRVLERPGGPQDVVERLHDEYPDANREIMLSDVAIFLGQLKAAGALQEI